mgnify:CR=1 FL=1
MSAICPNCSTSDDPVEFPTVRELVEHTQGGHLTRPEKKVSLPKKPLRPSATELQERQKTVQSSVTGDAMASGSTPAPVNKPLRLEYKWTGVHAVCNTEPKTIEIRMSKSVIVVAYCIGCDRELDQMDVPPLLQHKKK